MKKNRLVLILSASGGAGHIRAGEALLHGFRAVDRNIQAEHHNCLDFTSKLFKRFYAQSYLNMVNHAPDLWGYLYSQSEKKRFRKKALLELFDYFNYRPYLHWLADRNPEAIACTHFLPFMAIARHMRKAGITAPVYAVTTDFDAHQFWIDPIVERYFVFNRESAWQLRAKGVPANQLSVRGIPVMPEFSRPLTQQAARRTLKVPATRTTILLMSGGFGVGRFEELVGSTLEVLARFRSKHFTVLAVCGRNEQVKNRIEQTRTPDNTTMRVFGFVDTISTLMAASDLLISKAGGLTSAESMSRSLPMLIVDPIPGQETRNADMIVEQRAGWKSVNMSNLMYKLWHLLEHPAVLRGARLRAKEFGHPHAARDIASEILTSLRDGVKKGAAS